MPFSLYSNPNWPVLENAEDYARWRDNKLLDLVFGPFTPHISSSSGTGRGNTQVITCCTLEQDSLMAPAPAQEGCCLEQDILTGSMCN